MFVGLGICGFLLGLPLLHEDLEEVFFHCQADEKQPIQRFSDSRITERPYPRDSTEDTWSARYSCSLGEDTFTVTITREYMLINGFEEDATLAAVEAWADKQTALGGESA